MSRNSLRITTDGNGTLGVTLSGDTITFRAWGPGSIHVAVLAEHRRTGKPFSLNLEVRAVKKAAPAARRP